MVTDDVDDAIARAEYRYAADVAEALIDRRVLASEVKHLRRVLDGIRVYIEEIETPFDVSEVLDRIYEMVGGVP